MAIKIMRMLYLNKYWCHIQNELIAGHNTWTH